MLSEYKKEKLTAIPDLIVVLTLLATFTFIIFRYLIKYEKIKQLWPKSLEF